MLPPADFRVTVVFFFISHLSYWMMNGHEFRPVWKGALDLQFGNHLCHAGHDVLRSKSVAPYVIRSDTERPSRMPSKIAAVVSDGFWMVQFEPSFPAIRGKTPCRIDEQFFLFVESNASRLSFCLGINETFVRGIGSVYDFAACQAAFMHHINRTRTAVHVVQLFSRMRCAEMCWPSRAAPAKPREVWPKLIGIPVEDSKLIDPIGGY